MYGLDSIALRFEGADLEVDHHKASEPQVIKEQIDIKIIFGYIKTNLAPRKRKPAPSSSRKRSKCAIRPLSRTRLLQQSEKTVPVEK